MPAPLPFLLCFVVIMEIYTFFSLLLWLSCICTADGIWWQVRPEIRYVRYLFSALNFPSRINGDSLCCTVYNKNKEIEILCVLYSFIHFFPNFGGELYRVVIYTSLYNRLYYIEILFIWEVFFFVCYSIIVWWAHCFKNWSYHRILPPTSSNNLSLQRAKLPVLRKFLGNTVKHDS